jgi:hypothetical protein
LFTSSRHVSSTAIMSTSEPDDASSRCESSFAVTYSSSSSSSSSGGGGGGGGGGINRGSARTAASCIPASTPHAATSNLSGPRMVELNDCTCDGRRDAPF